MRDGGSTVREDQVTVREGGTSLGQGGATVREGGAPADRSGATVRESGAPADRSEATVRESGASSGQDGATVREGMGPSSASAAGSQDEQFAGWLPRPLAAQFSWKQSLPAKGGEADLYILEPRNTSPGSDSEPDRVAKVYRQGIAPKEDVIKRVQAADPAHVVQLEAYGQDMGRWWELMEYVENGSLRVLIDREGPRLEADLIREILEQLNEALDSLHKLDLEHRDLKPANVLVRTRQPLDLIVTDFGISSLMDTAQHFTVAARTAKYAPPESAGRTVMIEHTTWDYWSLGMMLLEMLQGAHPYDGLSEAVIQNRLSTQNVDQLVEGISDPDWRNLCRGLLRRTQSKRWDAEAVSKWLADPKDPSLAVGEETPAARPSAQAQATATIAFDGALYATPAELGAALAEDWDKAQSFWTRRFRDVYTWLADELGHSLLAVELEKLDDSDAPLESQVFSFIYLLAPTAPVRFRNRDISLEGLVQLGEAGARLGDNEASSVILALFRQRILPLAGMLPDQEALADVSRRWVEAVDDYRRKREEFEGRDATVRELDDQTLVLLLAASTPGSALLGELRVDAHRARTEDALKCAWFSDLGLPEDMSAATLCILPDVVELASKEGRLVKWRRFRGCVAGIVVGGLFGSLVEWADKDYSGGEFEESFLGAWLLVQVIIALVLIHPWYHRGIRGLWNRVAQIVTAIFSALFSSRSDGRRDYSDYGNYRNYRDYRDYNG